MRHPLTATFAAMTLALSGCTAVSAAPPEPSATAPAADVAAMRELLEYARDQRTTGFRVVQDGKVIASKDWRAPENPGFALFVHGTTEDGSLLEDVASQQKSFIAVLMAIAADRGLVDVHRPVSDYIGDGWSQAPAERESTILVADLLTMSSGLDEKLGYEHPRGTQFFYNTPAFAVSKKVLVAASGLPLERLTHEWLTGPAGMTQTGWRRRPAALGNVGNNTGLVTSPDDSIRFGQLVVNGGVTPDGVRIVSEKRIAQMLQASETNPAYGQLWWLNGSEFTMRGDGKKRTGPLIAAAPDDLVGAFGFLDRRLYIVPGMKVIVVRTGAAATDKDFDEQLWRRLMPVLKPRADRSE